MAPTTAIPASRGVAATVAGGISGGPDEDLVFESDLALSPADELAVARFRQSLREELEFDTAEDLRSHSVTDSAAPYSDSSAPSSSSSSSSAPGATPSTGPGSAPTSAPSSALTSALTSALDRAGDATRRSHIAAADQWRAIDDVLRLAEERPSLYLHGLASDSRDDREFAVRSAIADLAVRLVESEHSIRIKATQARTLRTSLPTLWSAVSSGDAVAANGRYAAELVQALLVRHRTSPDTSPDLDSTLEATISTLDDALTPLARTLPPPRFRARARALSEKLQADSAQRRHRQAMTLRGLTIEPAADGMAWLSLLLPAATATAAYHRIDATARQLQRLKSADDTAGSAGSAGTAGTTLSSDQRTLAQLRADIAADLLCGEPASEIRATVAVTVPVLTLLGSSDEVATLDGYGPIDAETARRLAAHAPSFTRLLTHPVSSAVLDVDRTSYRPPADLKKWLALRDRTCRFPGCGTRAVNCDVDHIQDWQHGGPTTVGNLHHLCRHHHRLKHRTAWTVKVTEPARARPSAAEEQPMPDTGYVGSTPLTNRTNTAEPSPTIATVWTSPTGYSATAPPPPF